LVGGFCRPRISPNLARHYEEEVRQGRVLISVELHDASNRDKWRRRLSGQAEWMFIIPTKEQPEGRPLWLGDRILPETCDAFQTSISMSSPTTRTL